MTFLRELLKREARIVELGFRFLPRSMFAPIAPPPIGRVLCFGCWAPNEHATWDEARAAGWYAGTWYGPDGWAIVCPDCYAADAEPVPR